MFFALNFKVDRLRLARQAAFPKLLYHNFESVVFLRQKPPFPNSGKALIWVRLQMLDKSFLFQKKYLRLQIFN